jgi:uncharacterized protein (TIGR00255 family)
MTGYALKKSSFTDIAVSVEILGVNKRHLDVQMKLSAEFLPLDPHFRTIIAKYVERGSVQVNIRVSFIKDYPMKMRLNAPLFREYASLFKQMSKQLGSASEVDLMSLAQVPGIIDAHLSERGLKHYAQLIEKVLVDALAAFLKAKEKEGKALQHEFEKRVQALQADILKIKKKTATSQEKMYAKLQMRLEELMQKSMQDDERLHKEVAFLVEKADISEEISRFEIHLESFLKKCIGKEQEAKGKHLEFIIQELHREINTICSKSQDASLTTCALHAKGEIEKLREQVQNVE